MDVLTEIKKGTVLPTRIMYGAKLSWTMLREALETLTALGLIEKQQIEVNKKSKKTYTLTGKGNNVLNYFNLVKELLEPEIVEVVV